MPRKAKSALNQLATRLEMLAFVMETEGEHLMRQAKDLPASDIAQTTSNFKCTTGQFVYAMGTIMRQIANDMREL